MEYLPIDDHDFTTISCAKCGQNHRTLVPCGLRFCPVCSIKRGVRVRSYLHRLFRALPAIPKYRIKMITLSCPNTPDLKIGVDHLIKSFRRLRQRKLWMKSVRGGIAIIEIVGRPGSFHPHLHIICQSKYIPWELLLTDWVKVSGGSAVWISNIPSAKAVYYAVKYVTKLDMPVEAQRDPNIAMYGRHLFIKFGDWSKLDLPADQYFFCCDVCGHSDWITEWDIRRLSKRQY